jgi:hypothetical protein
LNLGDPTAVGAGQGISVAYPDDEKLFFPGGAAFVENFPVFGGAIPRKEGTMRKKEPLFPFF